jgi:hypothetical protein
MAGDCDTGDLNITNPHRTPDKLTARCDGPGGERSRQFERLHATVEVLCQELRKSLVELPATGAILQKVNASAYLEHRYRSRPDRFGRLVVEPSARRSVAIELNQSLVADPEVMRDLVQHDVSDLAA